jgi:tau tubulin kinase
MRRYEVCMIRTQFNAKLRRRVQSTGIVENSQHISLDAKSTTAAQANASNTCQQQSLIPTALSRISEDSPRPTVPHRCLNIAGIEKYPELQGALPRAWSVPVLAPHVRAYLEAPLVCITFYL